MIDLQKSRNMRPAGEKWNDFGNGGDDERRRVAEKSLHGLDLSIPSARVLPPAAKRDAASAGTTAPPLLR